MEPSYSDFFDKKFSVSVSSDSMFQRTDIFMWIDGEGDFRVPHWTLDDERWFTTGIFVGKDQAKAMTYKEYEEEEDHFEDDLYDWYDVCEAINDSKDDEEET